MTDKIKLLLAALVLAAGIAGFYLLSDQSLLLRVIALLVLVGVSVAIALQSDAGRAALGFVREARTEVRKVVWPTRKETVQTSLLVVATAVVVALLLWAMDSVLFWAVRWLTGQGS